MKPKIASQDSLTPRYAVYRQRLCARDARLDDRLHQGRMVVTTLGALVPRYEVILLDAFGVLNLGEEGIPGAPEAVGMMRACGKMVRVVSNNASQSPVSMIKKLHKLGFDFRVEEIISSGMAAHAYLAQSVWQGRPYLLIGSEESAAVYAYQSERYMVNRLDTPWKLEDAEFILFCSNRDYHGQQQEQDALQLLQHKRVPILLANPDLATPKPDGRLEPVAGFAAMELVERFDLTIEGIGKPFAPIFDEVVRQFPEVPRTRILMIGDTLDTDVLGAAAMGFASCLTLSGACAGWGERLSELCTARGICPDWVIESLGH
ncbi:MAG: TIGR01459 family HAD-type hydrolase [Magnetococcales bacterium]|nr:TIGR01459 family HAD-type hydrolase [Magnetococcales bacterium]NGZ07044.1 TIGR01459 family HAD-type hydrolase [Magnetococcales bacterium]